MTDTGAALLCSAILFLAVLTNRTGQKRGGQVTLTVISQFDLPSIKFPQGVSSNSPHPFGLQPTHQRLNIYLIVTVPRFELLLYASTMLRVFQASPPGILPTPPPVGAYLILPILSIRRQPQREDLTCPRSPSQQVVEREPQALLSDFQLGS